MSETGQVDTSMYGHLGGQDPIAMLSGIQNLQNARLAGQGQAISNAQAQQELRSKLAVGRVTQQATGPDGQINFSKALTLAAQDPDAAFAVPDFAEHAMKLQGVSAENLLKNLDVATKRNEIYGNAAASVLSKGTDITRGKDLAPAISQAYSSLMESGVHDQDTLDGLLKFLGAAPQGGQQLYDYVHRAAQQAAGATDALNRAQENLHPVDTGSAVELYGYNPNQPQAGVRHLGTTPKNLTPGEAIQPVPVTGPEGVQTYVPQGQLFGARGAAAAQGVPGAGPTASLGPYGGGRLGMALDTEKQINEDAKSAQTALYNNQKLEQLLHEAKPGWGASERNQLANMLGTMGVSKSITDAIGNGSLASGTEIMKYAVPAAMSAMHSASGSSRPNQMLEQTFLHAFPNIETNPDAFKHMLEFNKKILKLALSKQQAFARWRSAEGPDGAPRNPADFENVWTQALQRNGVIQP